MNEMSEAIKSFQFILYAGDTILSTTLKNQDIRVNDNTEINKELSNISHCLNANITVKIYDISLYIQIEDVNNFKFLGFTINEHSTWTDHSAKIPCNISRSIGILNKFTEPKL